MSWYRLLENGAFLVFAHCKPRASKSRVLGLTQAGDALEVALAAPPVDGAANEALVEVLSDLLHVRKRSISITRGETARYKQILVNDVTESELQALARG